MKEINWTKPVDENRRLFSNAWKIPTKWWYTIVYEEGDLKTLYSQHYSNLLIGLSQKRPLWSKAWCLVVKKLLKNYDLRERDKSYSPIEGKLDCLAIWGGKSDLAMGGGVNCTCLTYPQITMYDLPPSPIAKSDLPSNRRVRSQSCAKDLFYHEVNNLVSIACQPEKGCIFCYSRGGISNKLM